MNRKSDRTDVVVICADLRVIAGSRAAKNRLTSAAVNTATRSTSSGKSTTCVNGPTQWQ
ncbi:hypothetical protein GALL_361880 [mine drainage metagenome]|uniref:Uncharacterized protein n=1 Tax=mine drainage metagenome TaxID=410659 RepID=A0A1J5QQ25_9ZZZZ